VSRLDRDTVVRSAIALADKRGLGAVSVRQVAEQLGVTPMALYRHVGGKDGLLDGVADALYAEIDLPRPDEDWWDGLEALAHSTRSVLIAHAWSVPLFSRPLAGPHARALDGALQGALRRAGFSVRETNELHHQLANLLFALVAPELHRRTNRAAFQRGLDMLHAGLEARLAQRR
jgi:AcrR family transcriptional regulator